MRKYRWCQISRPARKLLKEKGILNPSNDMIRALTPQIIIKKRGSKIKQLSACLNELKLLEGNDENAQIQRESLKSKISCLQNDLEALNERMLTSTHSVLDEKAEEIKIFFQSLDLDRKFRSIHNFEFKGIDLLTLRPEAWVNDQIINAYFQLLSIQGSVLWKKRIDAVDSILFPLMKTSSAEHLYQYTRCKPLLDADVVLVPIHLPNHWALVTINLQEKKLLYWDGIFPSNKEPLNVVFTFLKGEYKLRTGVEISAHEWTLTSNTNITNQENTYDCGLYVLLYARKFLAGSPGRFKRQRSAVMRYRIAKELVEQSLQYLEL